MAFALLLAVALLAGQAHALKYRQVKIDQLTQEMALLNRWQFGCSGERPGTACLKKPLMRTSPPSSWSRSVDS